MKLIGIRVLIFWASVLLAVPFSVEALPEPAASPCPSANAAIVGVDGEFSLVPYHLVSDPVEYVPPATIFATTIPGTSIPHKASWIGAQADLQGTIAEIGAGQKVAELIHTTGRPRFLFNAVSAYDMSASDDRYGRAGTNYDPADYISRTRLRRQLEVEFAAIRPSAGVRRFVVADTVSTSRGNGQGWMGFQGELVAGNPELRVVLHARLLGPTTANQKLDLGALGVNLIYASYHYLKRPKAFLRSLLHGITPGQVEIDVFEIEGPGSEPFKNENLAALLIESGVTPYCLLSPEGRLVAPQAELGRKVIHVEGGPSLAAPDGVPSPESANVRFVRVGDVAQATPIAKTYSLVGKFTDGDNTPDYLSKLRPPKREKSPDTTATLISAARDIIDWKARIINIYDELKGSVVEIGVGSRIAGRIFEAPFCHTLFETSYFPQVAPAETHEAAARRIAELEIARVRYHKPHRKFSIVAITMGETEALSRGVIVLNVQLEKDGPISKVYLHYSLPAAERVHQAEVVGALGVNLLYGVYHYLDRPEVFFRSLLHGVRVENARLERVTFEGKALEGLELKKSFLNSR